MTKKYELTDERNDAGLIRIRALRNFDIVKTGDLGGYIESEYNLSHEDDCWIFDKAMVSGNARVFECARVSDFAHVFGEAEVFGYAEVCGHAQIFGTAKIFDGCKVAGTTFVSGNARIFGVALLSKDEWVKGNKWRF